LKKRPQHEGQPGGGSVSSARERVYLAQVRARPEELGALMKAHRLEAGCLPRPVALPDRTIVGQVLAEKSALASLRAAGVEVKVLADVDGQVRRLGRFRSTGDRCEGGRKGLPTLGRLV
jgi:hypothetical protein